MSGRLVRATEALNRHFRLPDCQPGIAMRYRDELSLFPLELYPQCLRGEMNHCVAPCAGAIGRSEYAAQLQRARAFLEGRDDAPLQEIQRSMRQAVDQRRFERAAHLRDLLSELQDLRDRLMPRPDLLPRNFVYPLEQRQRTRWLVVQQGAVVRVGFAPRSSRAAFKWSAQLNNWDTVAGAHRSERGAAELRMLSSWFRRHSTELERVLDFAAALEICDRYV
jgi:excinuclease ABC subunit C